MTLGILPDGKKSCLAEIDINQRFPKCSEAFEAGSLSYSKARAMTRIADRRNEPALLEYALSATASQVEDHCRQLRNAQRRVSTNDANLSVNLPTNQQKMTPHVKRSWMKTTSED